MKLRLRLRRVADLVAFVAISSLSALPAVAQPIELKVMSFNIRFAHSGHSEARAENNWNDPKFPRRERVVRVIRDYDPDVLGVQEARHGQIVDLREALPRYEFYGVGRDDGKTDGEYTGIFFRKGRFKKLDAGSFWLSSEPEKPGSKFKDAPDALTRMASWVLLSGEEPDSKFLVLNTHWDHISKVARRESADLIRNRLSELSRGAPAIVMGDLNTPETSRPLKILLKDGALIDSYRALFPAVSADEGSFGGWQGKRDGHRIDFILHTPGFKPIAAEILRTSYDGLWPSDHYPVTATLRIAPATSSHSGE